MGIKFNKKTKKKTSGVSNKNDTLRHHLHKQLQSKRPARSTKIIHASEMMKKDLFGNSGEFCPREYALLDVLGKTRPDEHIKTCSQMVFNFGHKIEDIIIDTLASADMVIGDWGCQHCNKEYGFQKRPKTCNECKHTQLNHIESRFTSEDSGLSCGVDLLVPTLDSGYRIVELKSIKDEEFKKLEAPLAEHKWRTNLYMRIVQDSSGKRKHKIITDEATVLYVSKGGYGCKDRFLNKEGITDGPFSPFKEFKVKRDDKETNTKWFHSKMLKEYRDGKRKMVKGICRTNMCNRAQTCPVAKECFSKDYIGYD